MVGYKQICVTDELCRSVQQANGMPLRQHQTLGGLVSIMTAQRGICGLEDLISEERTRHEVRVDGRVLYSFCFVDALMLPFCCGAHQSRRGTSAPVGDSEGGICRCRGLHHTSKGRSCRDG